MKLHGRLSASYPVERSMKQGSVLSPALFLLVMDALLRSYITVMLEVSCMTKKATSLTLLEAQPDG